MRPVPATPGARYFLALLGRWEGTLALRIHDARALRASPARVRLVGLAVALRGRVVLGTSLEADGEGVFRHTTRATALGVTVLATEERLTLGPDGAAFTVEGTQRLLGRGEPYRGEGRVDDDALGARYALSWLGAPLAQRTRVEPPGLRLTQRTAWSEATVLLRRRR